MERRQIGRPALFWEFLKIGTVGVGGLGSLLAFIERELVDKRQVLSRDDVAEAMTYTKSLPGSTGLQVSSYLGYKLHGWAGSALATGAYLLPSVLMMLLLSAGYVAASALPAVGPTVNGVTVGVVGVLLATTYRLGKGTVSPKQPLTVALALAAFVAGTFLGVNVAVIVVVAGLIGILRLSIQGGGWAQDKRAGR